ncbi:HAMP domain-containing protein [Oxalobacteraceae bacterium CAVE-383]|nr:HAMP domain-containing protein [Oxalobacteraceae bacterium CAVE-383]
MKNMKIGNRLSAAFGLVLLLSIVVSAYSLSRMSGIQDKLNAIVNVNDVKQGLATTMFDTVSDEALGLRNLVLLSDPAAIRTESARLADTKKQYEDAKQALQQILARPGAEDPAERTAFATILANESAAKNIFSRLETLSTLQDAQDHAQAVELLMGDARTTQRNWRQSLSGLVKFETGKNLAAVESVDRVSQTTRTTIIAIVAAGVLLCLLVIRFMTRSITHPLTAAVGIAQQVARGDLTAEIMPASRDETGQLISALGDMNASLASIVGKVRNGADVIGTASSQIASGNLDLSSRTEEQAGSLQQTAAAMEELTATVRQNAGNAQRASQLALSASGVAADGGAIVGRVVATMADVNASSERISGIVNVIDTIAFQTNMLALNASVEAARAGEQGRGFAVVAAEVRALAQHSASAAKEIKTLIGASVDKMATASRMVSDAGSTMDDIIVRIRNVSEAVDDIAAAGEKQSAGIEQINAAIVQMDSATQQNAALVEEAAAASQSLREQALTLTQLVHVFKLAGNGGPQPALLSIGLN